MSIQLLPCPSCSRHVRASERACPFCAAALDTAAASARLAPAPTSRLGRAATFAFGAAVATTLQVSGCAESETRMPDAGTIDGAIGPVYGGPPTDAGADAGRDEDASAEVDAGEDAGGPAPAYGAPPEP